MFSRVWGLGVHDGIELHMESTGKSIVEARKLEHGFRRISARIPYTLP